MLVLLRVSIGWHFLYAGIWKFEHPEFSSAPFLGQAKGPLAQEFYKLVPDIDGVERLEITLDKAKAAADKSARNKGAGNKTVPVKAEADKGTKADSKEIAPGKVNKDQMEQYVTKFIAAYNVNGDQEKAAERFKALRLKQMDEFFKDHEEDFRIYKLDLEALHKAQTDPGYEIPYQQQRNWKKQNELRSQAKGWLAERDQIWEGLEADLHSLLSKAQLDRGKSPESPIDTPNHLDELVKYSNVAIGVCLMVGLFTRFASFAGALFLLQIVLAHPDWPGLLPPPHPSAGHSLIVNGNFIFMMAMFALAATPVGRWGGLDFLVHNLLIRPIFGKRD